MSKQPVYKVVFLNQGKVYEVYARQVHQGAMFGFIEIEKLLFDEKSSVVVDPSEEKLKSEFANVVRSYIPMHSIVRIDEVSKRGSGKISDAAEDGNVTQFPVYTRTDGKN